eukprot:5091464-Prymnesium_polylepis.1
MAAPSGRVDDCPYWRHVAGSPIGRLPIGRVRVLAHRAHTSAHRVRRSMLSSDVAPSGRTSDV